MKPYYDKDGITIYNGDCLEVMQTLEPNSFDLVLTDPPYGTTACKWDVIIPFDLLWLNLKQLTKKNSPNILFGSEPFSSQLRISNIKNYRYDWYWIKEQPTLFQHAKNRPMQALENISVFSEYGWGHKSQMGEKRLKYNPQGVKNDKIKKFHGIQGQYIGERQNQKGREYMAQTGFPNNLLKFYKDKNSIHPTQKPVALMEYLVKTYTDQNDLILDPFMGSGTTLVAAKKLKRRAVGIELSEQYCQIAVNRLENTLDQGTLF